MGDVNTFALIHWMVLCVLVVKATRYSLLVFVQVKTTKNCAYSYHICTYVHCVTNTITEINECTLNKTICGTDKDCNNTLGDYLCLCKTGFQKIANGSCEGMNYILSMHRCTV